MQALDVMYYTLALGFLLLVGAILTFIFYAWTTLKIIRSAVTNLQENHLKLGIGGLSVIGIIINLLKRR